MEFRRVLCRSLGGEATFGGLTPVGGDVGVELVDGEVVKEVFAGEHDGQVLAGLDGDVARVEREVGGGHFDLAGAVGDRAVLLVVVVTAAVAVVVHRSEEHTSELQSLMRISYAVFCLKKKQKSI